MSRVAAEVEPALQHAQPPEEANVRQQSERRNAPASAPLLPHRMSSPDFGLSANQSGADNEVIGQLAAVMGRKHLTKLPTFAGDEKEWAYFEVVFNRTTVEGRYTEADNAARLREALRQPALTLVQSQLMYSTSASEVMDSLRAFYGRPEKMIFAHMQSLMEFDKRVCSGRSRVRRHHPFAEKRARAEVRVPDSLADLEAARKPIQRLEAVHR